MLREFRPLLAAGRAHTRQHGGEREPQHCDEHDRDGRVRTQEAAPDLLALLAEISPGKQRRVAHSGVPTLSESSGIGHWAFRAQGVVITKSTCEFGLSFTRVHHAENLKRLHSGLVATFDAEFVESVLEVLLDGVLGGSAKVKSGLNSAVG